MVGGDGKHEEVTMVVDRVDLCLLCVLCFVGILEFFLVVLLILVNEQP